MKKLAAVMLNLFLIGVSNADRSQGTMLVTVTLVNPPPIMSAVADERGIVTTACTISNGQTCPAAIQPEEVSQEKIGGVTVITINY